MNNCFEHMNEEDKKRYIKESEEIIIELKKIQKEIFYIIKEKYDYKSPIVPALVENAIQLKRQCLEKILEKDKSK